jgi:PAS domain S-box-containing protein
MPVLRLNRLFPSLGARLLLLVLAALLPAVFLIAHSALEQRESKVEEVQAHAQEIASLAASEEEQLVAGFRQLLMTLARLPVIRDGSPEAFREVGRELIRENPRVHNIARVDLDGDTVASVLPLPGPVNVKDRGYFGNALRTRDFAIGDYQIGRISGLSTLNFAYPVRNAAGEITGVLYMALDLDWLNRAQARRSGHVPAGATLTRVDRQGVVYAQYPDADGLRGNRFPVPEVLDALRRTGNETVEATGPDGVPRFYVITRISRPTESGSAYVVLGMPRSALFAEGNRLLRLRLLGLGLVALLGTLATWFGSNVAILQPARALLDATRRFGEGDLSARTGLPPAEGELGALAAGFDRMAESIESRERERQAGAARLSTALAQLRALGEASPDMIALHGEDGRIIDVNDRTLETLGVTREEIVGKSTADFSLECRSPEEADARLREAFAGGAPEFEWFTRRKDGTGFPTEIRLRRFERLDEDGVVHPCVLATIRDISERKRQEAALREAEQLYRTLIETLPDAVTVTDIDGTITYVSPRTVEMYGADSPSAAVGTSVLDWIDPEDHARAIASIRNVMAGFHSDDNEYLLHRVDGSRFVGAINAMPLHDADGLAKGMIATTRDTTERKHQEEALRRSNALFQALISASPLAIAILSPEGVVREWNPAAERISGWPPESAIGRHLPIDPATADEASLAILNRILNEERVTGLELSRPRKDGSTSVVNFSSALLRDAAGAVEGVLLLGEDITGRKLAETRREELEAQLRQSQKMEAVGQLAGGIAHDFNNLMTVVLGQLELIRKRWADPRLAERLDEIDKAGQRAATLTRQLLAFSRRQMLQPRVVDLNAVLEDMRAILDRLIGENYQLVIEPACGLWPVLADPTQIGQVVVNLVVNARDALPEGGAIRVSTRNAPAAGAESSGHAPFPSGDYVGLSVRDDGVGMDDATKARLFEPFFTTKEIGKGTGLGLSTVYGIVMQSGGDIRVESAAGEGTTVDILLPRTEGEAHLPIYDENPDEPPPGSGTLLLVEDAGHVREMVREILEEYGYTVIEADSGQAALDAAAAHDGPIELMLSDMVMPGMSGRKLAEAMAAIRPGIKVLLMSGYAEDPAVRAGIQNREFSFLQKPFTPESLGWKIHEVIAGREA